jgi:hypothetical protein
MQDAYQIAAKTADKGAVCGKTHYDRKVQGRDLQPGDRVLLRNLTPRGGPGKIQSYWEDQVYKVKERKADDSPVYQISPENGKGRDRVVHRNLLLPCDYLPVDQPSATNLQPKKDAQRPAKKGTRPRHQPSQPAEPDNTDDDDDDNDYEYTGNLHWHLRPGRGRRLRHLDPLAEPFQPQHQEEDVPLQSEEDLPPQSEEDLPLQSEEDLPL